MFTSYTIGCSMEYKLDFVAQPMSVYMLLFSLLSIILFVGAPVKPAVKSGQTMTFNSLHTLSYSFKGCTLPCNE